MCRDRATDRQPSSYMVMMFFFIKFVVVDMFCYIVGLLAICKPHWTIDECDMEKKWKKV